MPSADKKFPSLVPGALMSVLRMLSGGRDGLNLKRDGGGFLVRGSHFPL